MEIRITTRTIVKSQVVVYYIYTKWYRVLAAEQVEQHPIGLFDSHLWQAAGCHGAVVVVVPYSVTLVNYGILSFIDGSAVAFSLLSGERHHDGKQAIVCANRSFSWSTCFGGHSNHSSDLSKVHLLPPRLHSGTNDSWQYCLRGTAASSMRNQDQRIQLFPIKSPTVSRVKSVCIILLA
jgi:hypothetical protein